MYLRRKSATDEAYNVRIVTRNGERGNDGQEARGTSLEEEVKSWSEAWKLFWNLRDLEWASQP